MAKFIEVDTAIEILRSDILIEDKIQKLQESGVYDDIDIRNPIGLFIVGGLMIAFYLGLSGLGFYFGCNF